MGKRRTWMIVLGIIALVLCLPLLIGGAALAIVFGPDGRFTSGTEQINTTSRALVSATADVSGDTPGHDVAGVKLRLQLASTNGKQLFVGIGPASDVTQYLDGVDRERIDNVRFAPFRYQLTPVPGTKTPPPPGEQSFWAAKAQGSGQQTIDWEIKTGTYQVVVMNSDGSPSVQVSGRLGIEIPWIFPVALALLAVGLVFLVGGILLVVFGAKRRPLPPGQVPYGTPGYPYAYPGAPYPGAPYPGAPYPPGTVPPGQMPPPPSPAPPDTPPARPGDPLPPPPPPA